MSPHRALRKSPLLLHTHPTLPPPTPRTPQFFWDHRLPEVRDLFVSSVAATLDDPAVDGTFTDDSLGFPMEHATGPADIRMNASDVAELQYYTQAANAQLIDELVPRGKYVYQALSFYSVDKGATRSNCTAFMRRFCAAEWQSRPMTYAFDTANKLQSLAGFLVVRGPHAFIGFGFRSNQSNWDPLFLTPVGEPTGLCAEGPHGVFTRPWTAGTARLDCNTWEGTVPGLAAEEATLVGGGGEG